MCIDYVLFWYVLSICAKFMCIVMCAAYVRVYVRYYVLQYVQTLCAFLASTEGPEGFILGCPREPSLDVLNNTTTNTNTDTTYY